MEKNKNNEKYKIKVDEKHPNLIQKYIEDMQKLSPNSNPFKYIALHDRWSNLKDVIVQEHLEVFKHVSDKHPNIIINFEGRIKSPASTFEKSYMKTEETLKEDPELTGNPPIIYDGVACRMTIIGADYKVSQTAKILDDRTHKFYYAFRAKQDNKVSIFKILPGDCIVLENGNLIEVTKDNLICNPDGTLSIRNENGDFLSLTNRTIQKRDAQTLKQLSYVVNTTLTDYLVNKGYICIPQRKKDFIANPKFPKIKAKFNNFDKKALKSSKRFREKINFLKAHGKTLNIPETIPAYQSLHFGAYDPEYKYYFEYQVRSYQMHQISEYDRFIGHDTYKKIPIDASAPYRVPTTFAYKKFIQNGKVAYESFFYDEDTMYQKIFSKPKSEVLKEIAQMDKSEDLPEDIEEEPDR